MNIQDIKIPLFCTNSAPIASRMGGKKSLSGLGRKSFVTGTAFSYVKHKMDHTPSVVLCLFAYFQTTLYTYALLLSLSIYIYIYSSSFSSYFSSFHPSFYYMLV